MFARVTFLPTLAYNVAMERISSRYYHIVVFVVVVVVVVIFIFIQSFIIILIFFSFFIAMKIFGLFILFKGSDRQCMVVELRM